MIIRQFLLTGGCIFIFPVSGIFQNYSKMKEEGKIVFLFHVKFYFIFNLSFDLVHRQYRKMCVINTYRQNDHERRQIISIFFLLLFLSQNVCWCFHFFIIKITNTISFFLLYFHSSIYIDTMRICSSLIFFCFCIRRASFKF